MLERVSLIIKAEFGAASVRHGKMRYLRLPQSPDSITDGKPELGNQRSITAKMNIKFNPNQKVGTEAKNIDKPDRV